MYISYKLLDFCLILEKIIWVSRNIFVEVQANFDNVNSSDIDEWVESWEGIWICCCEGGSGITSFKNKSFRKEVKNKFSALLILHPLQYKEKEEIFRYSSTIDIPE